MKNLVLPAAEEVESIWTNKFGFSTITQDEVRVCLCFMHACMPACLRAHPPCVLLTNACVVVLQLMEYRKSYQIMEFQGSLMLQKPVPKCRVVGKSEGG